MNEMRKLMKAIDTINEAYQSGKTEHSGAKHGKGAYYGRKKEAKHDSNKNRRRSGKAASLGEDNRNTEFGDDTYGFPDNRNTEYDEPGATKYTRQYGNVTVNFDGDEVLITHGHGENIFLSMEEWKEFAGEIQDILI